MIDRMARDTFITLILDLINGKISNDEFEDALPETRDKAISEIAENGMWFLYSDLHEHKLIAKHKVSTIDKQTVFRWILFLKADLEYKWPNVSIGLSFLNKLSFGLIGQSQKQAWKDTGDIDYWPFINENQYNKTKTNIDSK